MRGLHRWYCLHTSFTIRVVVNIDVEFAVEHLISM
jgi:hypothetical protein